MMTARFFCAVVVHAHLRMTDDEATEHRLRLIQSEKNSLIAVVNNYKKKDLHWLDGVDHVEVGTCDNPEDGPDCGRRNIGESKPWMQWMVSNYDSLPDYVAFLHGDEKSWHSHLSVPILESAHPSDVQMLADDKCTWPARARMKSDKHGGGPASTLLYNAFFGISRNQAWDGWHMSGHDTDGNASNHQEERRGTTKYKCCSEMVVNSDRIRNVTKPVLEAVVTLITNHPELNWGYAFESFWQNLFLSDHAIRPREEVLKDLDPKVVQFSTAEASMDQRLQSPCSGFYGQVGFAQTNSLR
jgi:hypothetical protein